MSNIIDIIQFNDRHAYVLDNKIQLTYEKHGDLLIGSDDTQTFFSVLYYSPCGGNPNFGGNYAFGGRKFVLSMKDGTTTHCYGQYWDGRYEDAEKLLGVKFADFTHCDIDSLVECYVFRGGTADKLKLQKMIDDFFEISPSYKPWEYREYEKFIANREKPSGCCKECFIAGWINMYGTLIWGCNMSHCIAADEDE